MSKPTFAARCLLAEQCLPDAPYRAMLTKLHSEMLTALAEQPAQSTPFAYVWTNSKGQAAYGPIPHDIYSSEPLYKAPQPPAQQEPLPDGIPSPDELEALSDGNSGMIFNEGFPTKLDRLACWLREYAAIEAKLKENT
jgi:hypothetical protein